MTSRTILVHYHIFKNAGSSVDACLKASFGTAWAEFEGSHAHDIQSSTQLSHFLAANKHLVAVSSHLARPPLPWASCLPVVFLRHPLLRAHSVYEFTRKDSSQPYGDVARDAGFADYIRWALRNERGSVVIRNYQVIHLSDASWRDENILDAQAGPHDLEQACNLLTAWGVVGIVESYALSAEVFQKKYGPLLPGLEFRHLHENSTKLVQGTAEDQINRIRLLLGGSLYDEFMAINALDLDLYKHAQQVLRLAVGDVE
ncbi:hypothetical protein [Rhodanobacter koreensis]